MSLGEFFKLCVAEHIKFTIVQSPYNEDSSEFAKRYFDTVSYKEVTHSDTFSKILNKEIYFFDVWGFTDSPTLSEMFICLCKD